MTVALRWGRQFPHLESARGREGHEAAHPGHGHLARGTPRLQPRLVAPRSCSDDKQARYPSGSVIPLFRQEPLQLLSNYEVDFHCIS